MSYVTPVNGGEAGYRDQLQQIIDAGVCPFCRLGWHKGDVLARRDGWFVIENAWPYENAARHLLIISEKHKEGLDELTPEDLAVVLSFANGLAEETGGGALTLRFGDSSLTGASVGHLHWHLITPVVGDDGRVRPVYFPIG